MTGFLNKDDFLRLKQIEKRLGPIDQARMPNVEKKAKVFRIIRKFGSHDP